jgi:hypothetical protein
MKNLETDLEYAKFDHSDTRIRQAQYRHVPGWRGAWIYCLKHFDYEAAELIASRNLVSDECGAGAHDDCAFSWCSCNHHSAVQLRVEHPQLKSLREIQSERDEAA